MAVFWERLAGTQPVPPAWVIAASGAVALLVVLNSEAWRLARNVITIAHEGGHALVSLLSGRRLEGIRLHSDTSGETVTRGRLTGPGVVLTALAGYLTPPLLGLGTAWLLAAHHVTATLWLLLALLAATFLAIRNAFGVLAVLATAAAVCAVSWFASATVQAVFGYGVAWFLLLGGVRPIVELQRSRARARRGRSRGRAGASDADQLAGLTRVPAGVWVTLFALVAVAALALGARLLVPESLHLPQHLSQR
jgi:Peptidase M50B-like